MARVGVTNMASYMRGVTWVPAVRGRIIFFVKYGGPSGGSLLSGGGIIIFHVIRRHFLAAAMDPAVSLSTYSGGSSRGR